MWPNEMVISLCFDGIVMVFVCVLCAGEDRIETI